MLKFKKINFQKYNDSWERDQKIEVKKPIDEKYLSYGELHNEIKKRTKTIPEKKEELLAIIFLIQKWGGSTGRYFFIKKNGVSHFDTLKKTNNLIEIYLNAAKKAMNGDSNSFDEFCKIPGIKESFAGKHAYFWSTNKKPLIIIDKLLAEHFGFKTPAALLKECGGYSNLYDLFNKEYKTQNLSSILVLERGIFQHTRELNRK
jgi:hypothetical protein